MNEVSKPMRARRAPLLAARVVLAALSTAVVGIALAQAPALPQPATPAPVVARSSEPADATALTFQVASFAARANAEHALAMLAGAGIDGARLLDADANGRRVWRLRVGPVAPSAAQELIARIQGLGFGQPQRVRE